MKNNYRTPELRNFAEDFVAEMESYGEQASISLLLNFIDWLDGFAEEHYDEETRQAIESDEMLRSCNECGDPYTNQDTHPCFNI